MVEEVDVDADADVGLHAFGCVAVARLDAEAPTAGAGGGQGSLAHDEGTGVDFDAVELGAVPAHPGRVSRVAVHLLRNREHHRLRGVGKMVGGGRDIGGIFSNVCKIGRVCRHLDRHVPHHLFAHGNGATDAQGVADDEGVAAHGVHGRFGAATRARPIRRGDARPQSDGKRRRRRAGAGGGREGCENFSCGWTYSVRLEVAFQFFRRIFAA